MINSRGQQTPEIGETRRSGFRPFIIIHFIIIVSTFRGWFLRIGMRGNVAGESTSLNSLLSRTSHFIN
jgi:hypothetical protein